jgi:succinate dehydrogenase flavin-adding protein (antitoxin of CptAB toxin-antitoxin module)
MAPDGLRYVDSWVTEDLATCYQLMECDDRALLEAWMTNWRDLTDFEVVAVMSSAQAVEKIGPRL